MFRPTFTRVPRIEWLLCGFLLFSVLWRGGKSLETTWILVGVAAVLILADRIHESKQMENGKWKMENISNLASLFVFGFLAWTVFSYFFSTTANYGLDEVLRDGALVLIFLWTMRHTAGESRARLMHRFVQTVTIAAVLAALFGLLVYVMQPVNRFVGTFFDHRFHTDYWPNAWAQFLLLAWPIILLWIRERQGGLRVAGYGLLGGVLGTLLLSYSRGAMIAFGGQLAILGVWHWMRSKRDGQDEWKIMLTKIAVIVVTAIALFFVANAVRGQFHTVQNVGEKITFSADEGGSSIDERKQFWTQSMQLIAERPLFGWGPYSFRFVHQRLQTTVLATSDHPHNVFLKLASERGVPAALLFIALLLCILIPQIRLLVTGYWLRKPNASGDVLHMQPATRNPQLFLLVAVLGVLAHNLIDFNLQFVGIALPFWMMLGFLAGNSGKAGSEKTHTMNKKLVQNIELCIAVLLLAVAFREGAYLVTSSLGRHAEAAGETAAALRWYDRSEGEWFSRDMHLSRALLRTVRGETGRAQEAMDTFLLRNTEDPRGWRLQGDIAREQGNIAGAIEAYGKAYALGKWNDLSITLALAETLSQSDVEDKASLETLKPELDALLKAFVGAVIHNEHFVALSHNAEDAIALSALLAERFPDSAPRYEVLAARVDFAMHAERAKVKSRPAGYLW